MAKFYLAVTVQQDQNESIFTPSQEAEPMKGEENDTTYIFNSKRGR